VHPFYVIEATDWVNIIPVTPEGQLVFIRQYRHGVREVTLEVPGGMVDPGETAAEAARREMHEETGYDTEQIIHLGGVAPNPAIQNNLCHSYLALDARPAGTQNLEGTEEIEVVLVDPAEVPGLIVSGQITHALVVTAFYLYDQYVKRKT
jgi:8-oxo-dGTP pyrophosphatase MutT (NUDIX family)